MAIRRYKPTSPGRRFMSVSSFDEITKTEPEKSLTEPLKKSGGRNVNGRITRRHQGGGHKRQYRQIDFKRVKDAVPAKVAAIEYDPNRSARIALLHYADGAKAYILAPARLRVGAVVESGPGADIKPGNALPLENIPTGTLVHNVELKPGRGGQMARSAGNLLDRNFGGGVIALPLPLPPVQWHHIVYAYLLENTRIVDILRQVVFDWTHGERLPTATVATHRWLQATEQVFFANPWSYSVRAVTSHVRNDAG